MKVELDLQYPEETYKDKQFEPEVTAKGKVCVLPDGAKQPYYLYAPGYNPKSAGPRSLHLICHWLNRKGYPAFIHPWNRRTGAQIHPDLITPILTQRLIDRHHEAGQRPIVLYPEVVMGNPLRASCSVRYLLNYPGLLGGEKTYAANELIFSYTRRFAENVPNLAGVLFVPVIDTSIFGPGVSAERKGACFYAGKYKSAGNQVFDLPKGAIEIFRDPPFAQSPVQIAELFRTCEFFYTFEDTALILEAALCGCPTVVMRSHYFKIPAGDAEFGLDGIALDDSEEQKAHAQKTVSKVPETYAARSVEFFEQLDNFIAITQRKASEQKNPPKISFGPRKSGERVPKDAVLNRFLSVAEEKGFLKGTIAAFGELRNMTLAVRFKTNSLRSRGVTPTKKYEKASGFLNTAPGGRTAQNLVSLLANAKILRVYRKYSIEP